MSREDIATGREILHLLDIVHQDIQRKKREIDILKDEEHELRRRLTNMTSKEDAKQAELCKQSLAALQVTEQRRMADRRRLMEHEATDKR